MLLKIYRIEYENIWKANNPNDKLLIQMFFVEINDFMLIKMDMLSIHSLGIPMSQSREWFLVSVGSILEQIVWLLSGL